MVGLLATALGVGRVGVGVIADVDVTAGAVETLLGIIGLGGTYPPIIPLAFGAYSVLHVSVLHHQESCPVGSTLFIGSLFTC